MQRIRDVPTGNKWQLLHHISSQDCRRIVTIFAHINTETECKIRSQNNNKKEMAKPFKSRFTSFKFHSSVTQFFHIPLRTQKEINNSLLAKEMNPFMYAVIPIRNTIKYFSWCAKKYCDVEKRAKLLRFNCNYNEITHFVVPRFPVPRFTTYWTHSVSIYLPLLSPFGFIYFFHLEFSHFKHLAYCSLI